MKNLLRLPEILATNKTLDTIFFFLSILVLNPITSYYLIYEDTPLFDPEFVLILLLWGALSFFAHRKSISKEIAKTTCYYIYVFPLILWLCGFIYIFDTSPYYSVSEAIEMVDPLAIGLLLPPVLHYSFLMLRRFHFFAELCYQWSTQIVQGIIFVAGTLLGLLLGWLALMILSEGLSDVFRAIRLEGLGGLIILLQLLSVAVAFFIWIHVRYKPSLQPAQIQKARRFFGTLLGIIVLAGIGLLGFKSYTKHVYKTTIEDYRDFGVSREFYDSLPSDFVLKKAFWGKIKKTITVRNSELLYGQDLDAFHAIFDESPETIYKEKLKEVGYESPFNNATSVLADEEDAMVELSLAQYEVKVDEKTGIAQTTAEYSFQNLSSGQEEVIIEFSLPDQRGVITDLKLGPNLEHQGVIASRGAAEKVYRDSLRRQRDPALMQQVGVNLYRLRVFPIPPADDQKTNGKQRVEFSFIAPLQKGQSEISIAPRLKLYNLFTEETDFKARVYKGEKIIFQESKADIDADFLQQDFTAQLDDLKINKTVDMKCMHSELHTLLKKTKQNKNLKNMAVFLDNSISAGKANLENAYKQIVPQLETYAQENNLRLDLYTYNFDVTEVGGIKGMEFWGYSDSGKLIDFILKDNLKDTHILIVTDDSRFEAFGNGGRSFDFRNTIGNQVDILQINEELRMYPDPINFAVMATGGIFTSIKNNESIDITTVLEAQQEWKRLKPCAKKKTPKLNVQTPGKEKNTEQNLSIENPNNTDRLHGAFVARLLTQNIENSSSPFAVANTHFAISKSLGIVTPYATYIAIVEDWQKRNLDRYEKQADRYNQKYDDLTTKKTSTRRSFGGGLITPDDSPSAARRSTSSGSRGGGLISPDDCPSGVCTNTSFGGSLRQAIQTLIGYIGLFGAGLVGLILLIRVLSRRSRGQ